LRTTCAFCLLFCQEIKDMPFFNTLLTRNIVTDLASPLTFEGQAEIVPLTQNSREEKLAGNDTAPDTQITLMKKPAKRSRFFYLCLLLLLLPIFLTACSGQGNTPFWQTTTTLSSQTVIQPLQIKPDEGWGPIDFVRKALIGLLVNIAKLIGDIVLAIASFVFSGIDAINFTLPESQRNCAYSNPDSVIAIEPILGCSLQFYDVTQIVVGSLFFLSFLYQLVTYFVGMIVPSARMGWGEWAAKWVTTTFWLLTGGLILTIIKDLSTRAFFFLLTLGLRTSPDGTLQPLKVTSWSLDGLLQINGQSAGAVDPRTAIAQLTDFFDINKWVNDNFGFTILLFIISLLVGICLLVVIAYVLAVGLAWIIWIALLPLSAGSALLRDTQMYWAGYLRRMKGLALSWLPLAVIVNLSLQFFMGVKVSIASGNTNILQFIFVALIVLALFLFAFFMAKRLLLEELSYTRETFQFARRVGSMLLNGGEGLLNGGMKLSLDYADYRNSTIKEGGKRVPRSVPKPKRGWLGGIGNKSRNRNDDGAEIGDVPQTEGFPLPEAVPAVAAASQYQPHSNSFGSEAIQQQQQQQNDAAMLAMMQQMSVSSQHVEMGMNRMVEAIATMNATFSTLVNQMANANANNQSQPAQLQGQGQPLLLGSRSAGSGTALLAGAPGTGTAGITNRNATVVYHSSDPDFEQAGFSGSGSGSSNSVGFSGNGNGSQRQRPGLGAAGGARNAQKLNSGSGSGSSFSFDSPATATPPSPAEFGEIGATDPNNSAYAVATNKGGQSTRVMMAGASGNSYATATATAESSGSTRTEYGYQPSAARSASSRNVAYYRRGPAFGPITLPSAASTFAPAPGGAGAGVGSTLPVPVSIVAANSAPVLNAVGSSSNGGGASPNVAVPPPPPLITNPKVGSSVVNTSQSPTSPTASGTGTGVSRPSQAQSGTQTPATWASSRTAQQFVPDISAAVPTPPTVNPTSNPPAAVSVSATNSVAAQTSVPAPAAVPVPVVPLPPPPPLTSATGSSGNGNGNGSNSASAKSAKTGRNGQLGLSVSVPVPTQVGGIGTGVGAGAGANNPLLQPLPPQFGGDSGSGDNADVPRQQAQIGASAQAVAASAPASNVPPPPAPRSTATSPSPRVSSPSPVPASASVPVPSPRPLPPPPPVPTFEPVVVSAPAAPAGAPPPPPLPADWGEPGLGGRQRQAQSQSSLAQPASAAFSAPASDASPELPPPPFTVAAPVRRPSNLPSTTTTTTTASASAAVPKGNGKEAVNERTVAPDGRISQ
jgi:hypothetical protein